MNFCVFPSDYFRCSWNCNVQQNGRTHHKEDNRNREETSMPPPQKPRTKHLRTGEKCYSWWQCEPYLPIFHGKNRWDLALNIKEN